MRHYYQFPPSLIFNCDETMINLGNDRRKVAVFNEEPAGYRQQNSKMEHITLMLCVDAAGGSVKPTAIFPLKTIPNLSPEVISYFGISGSESGWINGTILNNWLNTVLIPHVRRVRERLNNNSPALLLLDNHSSRDSIDTEAIWRDHQIMILLLPPNTTHLTQPLDATVNGVFKHHFAQIFEFDPKDDAPTRRSKVMIASKFALSVALCQYHIVQGWIRTGLEPIDQNQPLNMAVYELNGKILGPSQQSIKRQRGPSIFNTILIPEEENLTNEL
jgi:hypothetical protein